MLFDRSHADHMKGKNQREMRLDERMLRIIVGADGFDPLPVVRYDIQRTDDSQFSHMARLGAGIRVRQSAKALKDSAFGEIEAHYSLEIV
jgi:hypothetical protein